MSDAHTSTTVFSTAWFDVVAKPGGDGNPYYALVMPDYVAVIALTADRQFVLVRQMRPPVDQQTLELPAGHVESGESPAESARRELEEETGYIASRIEPLGKLLPDTGRLSNGLWCYLMLDCVLRVPQRPPEPGIEVVLCSPAGLSERIRCGDFNHALHLGALHLALVAGRLPHWASPVAPP
jgi:ADP-ribose pyrophosphatase